MGRAKCPRWKPGSKWPRIRPTRSRCRRGPCGASTFPGPPLTLSSFRHRKVRHRAHNLVQSLASLFFACATLLHPVIQSKGPSAQVVAIRLSETSGKSLIFAVIVMALDVMQMELPHVCELNLGLFSAAVNQRKSEEKFRERSPISQLPRVGPHVRTWSNEIYMLLSSSNWSK
ncbi:hypothetical protein C4D60_Mb09t21630 [Musa balbisiana]|uniref:Uncharacterized protein n=1 Tax=Musa balbisiana TaxID=52838 RepID=A0A4S8IKJ9_MUSBA|nr:hypothetical protein C4D60_Mb09t21630 [Musa balbisiana]